RSEGKHFMGEITVSGPMLLFLICMTGFAGIVDSAAGGGGLISLPAYLFAGLPVHYTYGTNKFSAACGTTFATGKFLRSGALDVKVGLLAAAGSFAGSAAGSHLAVLLSDGTLRLMVLCKIGSGACRERGGVLGSAMPGRRR